MNKDNYIEDLKRNAAAMQEAKNLRLELLLEKVEGATDDEEMMEMVSKEILKKRSADDAFYLAKSLEAMGQKMTEFKSNGSVNPIAIKKASIYFLLSGKLYEMVGKVKTASDEMKQQATVMARRLEVVGAGLEKYDNKNHNGNTIVSGKFLVGNKPLPLVDALGSKKSIRNHFTYNGDLETFANLAYKKDTDPVFPFIVRGCFTKFGIPTYVDTIGVETVEDRRLEVQWMDLERTISREAYRAQQEAKGDKTELSNIANFMRQALLECRDLWVPYQKAVLRSDLSYVVAHQEQVNKMKIFATPKGS